MKDALDKPPTPMISTALGVKKPMLNYIALTLNYTSLELKIKNNKPNKNKPAVKGHWFLLPGCRSCLIF